MALKEVFQVLQDHRDETLNERGGCVISCVPGRGSTMSQGTELWISGKTTKNPV